MLCSVATRIERSGVNFDRTVLVNGSTVLKCDTVGVPRPVITWYKDGRPLTLGSLTSVRLLQDGAKLKIESANLSHSGTYECRAENDAGHDRVHYRLRVLGQSAVLVAF